MIADIALPIPVGKYFSYSVTDEFIPYISIWSRVRVPFHHRDAVGIVTDLREGDGAGLKPIIELLEFFPLVDEELAALADWASPFYLTPKGLVMKYALPPVRDIERYLAAGKNAGSVEDGKVPLTKMIKKMGRKRLIELFRLDSLALYDNLTHKTFAEVKPTVRNAADSDNEQIILIDSIERRLERYTALISRHLENDGNVLFLLPDHRASGAYFTQKLKTIYGDRVLWFTSGVPVRQRMETYFRTRHDGGNIILGNKNCVFLPVCNLSLIIAERYDDDEYRNEESFKFNAVRIAVERARSRGIPIILGGAACNVDIMHQSQMHGLALECHEWAMGERTQGSLKVVHSWSSGELLDRLSTDIIDTVRAGGNIAVYVPRKEYGSFLRCQTCRENLTCEKCGALLDYDRGTNGLYCTGCKAEHPYIDACPHCGSNMIGFARIGASFIYDHLSRNVPSVHAILITGDSLKKELSSLRRKGLNDARCIVGTQALSKLYGYHCDKLILIDWEELRKMSGFRSEEKAHQVLSNLVDALTPDEIICYSQKKKPVDLAPYFDISRFYERELQKRKDAEFPPFTRMFIIEARAKTQAGADRALAKVKTVVSDNGLDPFVFGTVPNNIHTFHSWKMLLKGPEDLLNDAFADLYAIPGTEIEADPPNF